MRVKSNAPKATHSSQKLSDITALAHDATLAALALLQKVDPAGKKKLSAGSKKNPSTFKNNAHGSHKHVERMRKAREDRAKKAASMKKMREGASRAFVIGK